jgi:hypothetical protein
MLRDLPGMRTELGAGFILTSQLNFHIFAASILNFLVL